MSPEEWSAAHATKIAREFELANKAFDIFTLAERKAALAAFAKLHYASVEEKFFDAVHQVIDSHRTALAAGTERTDPA